MNSKLSIAHHIEAFIIGPYVFLWKYIIILWYWPGSNPVSFFQSKIGSQIYKCIYSITKTYFERHKAPISFREDLNSTFDCLKSVIQLHGKLILPELSVSIKKGIIGRVSAQKSWVDFVLVRQILSLYKFVLCKSVKKMSNSQ